MFLYQYINKAIVIEQCSQVLCHGECTVCYQSVKGGAGMYLYDNDFPLPVEGRHAVEDIQRHMKEKMRDKGEQQ